MINAWQRIKMLETNKNADKIINAWQDRCSTRNKKDDKVINAWQNKNARKK